MDASGQLIESAHFEPLHGTPNQTRAQCIRTAMEIAISAHPTNPADLLVHDVFDSATFVRDDVTVVVR